MEETINFFERGALIEEFKWNLKRLIREGFPEGLPLHSVGGQYKHWLGKTINPQMMDQSIIEWRQLFQLQALRETFKIFKRDGIDVVRICKGPTDPEELKAILRLSRYEKYMFDCLENGQLQGPSMGGDLSLGIGSDSQINCSGAVVPSQSQQLTPHVPVPPLNLNPTFAPARLCIQAEAYRPVDNEPPRNSDSVQVGQSQPPRAIEHVNPGFAGASKPLTVNPLQGTDAASRIDTSLMNRAPTLNAIPEIPTSPDLQVSTRNVESFSNSHPVLNANQINISVTAMEVYAEPSVVRTTPAAKPPEVIAAAAAASSVHNSILRAPGTPPTPLSEDNAQENESGNAENASDDEVIIIDEVTPPPTVAPPHPMQTPRTSSNSRTAIVPIVNPTPGEGTSQTPRFMVVNYEVESSTTTPNTSPASSRTSTPVLRNSSSSTPCESSKRSTANATTPFSNFRTPFTRSSDSDSSPSDPLIKSNSSTNSSPSTTPIIVPGSVCTVPELKTTATKTSARGGCTDPPHKIATATKINGRGSCVSVMSSGVTVPSVPEEPPAPNAVGEVYEIFRRPLATSPGAVVPNASASTSSNTDANTPASSRCLRNTRSNPMVQPCNNGNPKNINTARRGVGGGHPKGAGGVTRAFGFRVANSALRYLGSLMGESRNDIPPRSENQFPLPPPPGRVHSIGPRGGGRARGRGRGQIARSVSSDHSRHEQTPAALRPITTGVCRDSVNTEQNGANNSTQPVQDNVERSQDAGIDNTAQRQPNYITATPNQLHSLPVATQTQQTPTTVPIPPGHTVQTLNPQASVLNPQTLAPIIPTIPEVPALVTETQVSSYPPSTAPVPVLTSQPSIPVTQTLTSPAPINEPVSSSTDMTYNYVNDGEIPGPSRVTLRFAPKRRANGSSGENSNLQTRRSLSSPLDKRSRNEGAALASTGVQPPGAPDEFNQKLRSVMSGIQQLQQGERQEPTLERADQVLDNHADWLAFPVQAEPLNDKIESRGFYKCTGEKVLFFRQSNWRVSRFPVIMDKNLYLPENTLVYGEFLDQYLGKANRYPLTVFHIIDAAVLGGIDVSGWSFDQRRKCCTTLIKSFMENLDKRDFIFIKLSPASALRNMERDIFNKLKKIYSDGIMRTYIPDKMYAQRKPLVEITGIVFVRVSYNQESSMSFTESMNNRFFWKFTSELSLARENLFLENQTDVCLCHFVEYFFLNRISEDSETDSSEEDAQSVEEVQTSGEEEA